MKARQEAKVSMFRAIIQLCEANAAIVATILAFQNAFNAFKATVEQISGATQLTDVPLQGITADKGNRKQTLAQRAADIAGIVFAFASANSNLTLRQEVNFNFSKLMKTRDEELAPRCQNIHDKAQENLGALKDYGIEAAQLAEMQTLIDDYAAATPKPRTAVSHRKTQHANVNQLIKQADEILKDQMDKLVVNFRAANPDFVAQYESNRIIIDPAKTTTELRGVVTNKTDGSFIKGALVTIVEKALTATTNSAGEYSIKPAPIGEFTIRVTKTGFEDLEMDEIDIKLGEINRLNLVLLA